MIPKDDNCYERSARAVFTVSLEFLEEVKGYKVKDTSTKRFVRHVISGFNHVDLVEAARAFRLFVDKIRQFCSQTMAVCCEV